MKTPTETREILDALESQHPEADTELHHSNAFNITLQIIPKIGKKINLIDDDPGHLLKYIKMVFREKPAIANSCSA